MKSLGITLGLVGMAFGAAQAQAGVYQSEGHKQIHEYQAKGWGAVGVIIDDRGALCSGSLIQSKNPNVTPGNQWILTAAHCVDFANSMTFRTNGVTYQAESWYVPDNWRRVIGDGNDIALIKLASPISDPDVDPLYLPTKGPTPDKNEQVAVIGFGTHGRSDTGPIYNADVRRLGHQVIEHVVPGTVAGREIYYDMDSRTDEDSAHPLSVFSETLPWEYGTAPGDSGGPDVMLGEIVGVHSWGESPAFNNRLSASTVVFDWIDWIENIITSGGNQANTSTPLEAVSGRPGVSIFSAPSFFGEGENYLAEGTPYADARDDSVDYLLSQGLTPWEVNGDFLYHLGGTFDYIESELDTSVPEPGVAMLFAIGAAAGAMRRRRTA